MPVDSTTSILGRCPLLGSSAAITLIQATTGPSPGRRHLPPFCSSLAPLCRHRRGLARLTFTDINWIMSFFCSHLSKGFHYTEKSNLLTLTLKDLQELILPKCRLLPGYYTGLRKHGQLFPASVSLRLLCPPLEESCSSDSQGWFLVILKSPSNATSLATSLVPPWPSAPDFPITQSLEPPHLLHCLSRLQNVRVRTVLTSRPKL